MFINILEILDINNIQYENKNNFYIDCPLCGGEKKINVNLEKNNFRCNKCGTSGGPLQLHATLRHGLHSDMIVGNREKTRELFNEYFKLSNSNIEFQSNKKEFEKIVKEIPKIIDELDLEQLNQVYSRLLKGLTLNKFHEESLIKRGLSKEIIKKNNYRSTPVVSKQIANKFVLEGIKTTGVPGFYEERGHAFLKEVKTGILIPVRTLEKEITSLQIRYDEKSIFDKKKFIKYSFLSSSNEIGGAKVNTSCHIVGPIEEDIIITEGVLKADIISFLGDYGVVAMPGVNFLKSLEKSLNLLKTKGLKSVKIAIDMDYKTNPHVATAKTKLIDLCKNLKLNVFDMNWDEKYKGLDDYLKYIKDENIKSNIEIKKL